MMNTPTFPRLIRLLVVAAAAGTLVAPTAVSAAAPSAQPARVQHCAAWVNPPDVAGNLTVNRYECFATLADEAAAETAAATSSVAAGDAMSSAATAATTKIAIHYDGPGLTGSSLSINGTSCTGGYINLSGTLAAWNDRITSTANLLCTSIAHWTDPNLTGTNEMLYSSGNLVATDNLVSSVQYN